MGIRSLEEVRRAMTWRHLTAEDVVIIPAFGQSWV